MRRKDLTTCKTLRQVLTSFFNQRNEYLDKKRKSKKSKSKKVKIKKSKNKETKSENSKSKKSKVTKQNKEKIFIQIYFLFNIVELRRNLTNKIITTKILIKIQMKKALKGSLKKKAGRNL